MFSVGLAEDVASSITDQNYRDSEECECLSCIEIENNTSCAHPNLCVKRANEMLDTIPEKWDPRHAKERETLTGPQEEETGESPSNLFDKRMETSGPVANIFRIFTTGTSSNKTYKPPIQRLELDQRTVMVDGLKLLPQGGRSEETMTVGVSFTDHHNLDCGAKWISLQNSARASKYLISILLASMRNGISNPLTIHARSGETIALLKNDLPSYEDTGYIGKKNGGILRTLVGRLRMHSGLVRLVDSTEDQQSKEDDLQLRL